MIPEQILMSLFFLVKQNIQRNQCSLSHNEPVLSVNQDSIVQQCNQIDSQAYNVIPKGLNPTHFAPLASIHTYADV